MDIVDILVILVFLGFIFNASKSAIYYNSSDCDETLLNIGLVCLPDTVIYEILKYVPRKDLLPMTMTNKRLSEIGKTLLYRDIRITWQKPKTVLLENWVILGVNDDSLHYISISPIQFWKLLHVYRLDPLKLHTIAIEASLSLEFIRKIISRFPAVAILYKKEDALSDYLFIRGLESRAFWISKIDLSSLAVTNMDGISVADLHLNRLNLCGNPMELQSHFKSINGLKFLSLEFIGPPEKLSFGKFGFDISKVSMLQMKFDTCFVLLQRPDIVTEINGYLFEEMLLPNIKGLSIFSRDNRKSSGSYKNALPFFGHYLGLLSPGLKYVHLSIGCEIDISGFIPGLLKHRALLERVVWIGNVNSQILPNQELKFDLIQGVRLTSSNWHVSQGRIQCNSEDAVKEVQHYVESMCRLGAARGSSYFELEYFNRCNSGGGGAGGDNIVEDEMIEDLAGSIKELVQKCGQLRYVVVNGVHLIVTSTYDGHLQMFPIYDEYGGSKAVVV